MKTQYFIVFFSAAGSTKHVAHVIEQELIKCRAEAQILDLSKEHDWSHVLDLISSAHGNMCLFIGSPVYKDQAAIPVMNFIEALPEVNGGFTTPFVTWGGASSGIALWQMASRLTHKGFVLAGAAKVLAVHSIMWRSDNPVGRGHPDADDDMAVKDLVQGVDDRVTHRRDTLPLDALDYQPEQRAVELKEGLTKIRPVTPKSVDETKCNQCQECMEQCPVDAITFAPYPQFGSACIECLNCVRICPDHAIEPKITLAQMEEFIRNRAETMKERPYTKVFI